MKYLAYKFWAHRPLAKNTRVVITHKVGEKATRPDCEVWVEYMDSTIGCHGVITGTNNLAYQINTPHVQLDRGDSWWYPNASLKVLRD